MSARPSVYLAGAITGLTFDQGQDWREWAKQEFLAWGIDAFSPLRGKDYLRRFGVLDNAGTDDGAYLGVNVLSEPKGILTRDRMDCTRRDLVLVNFLGAEKVSIGTVMEIAWADLARRPIVCAMEIVNPHRHAMVNEACGYIVPSLEEAVKVACAILLP